MTFRPGLSPLRVLNNTMSILAEDGIRLILSMALLFTLPSILLMHGLFTAIPRAWSFAYLWRIAVFYTGFFIASGIMSCVTGRRIINIAIGRDESFQTVIYGSLKRFLRASWIYLPLHVAALSLISLHYLYALPLLFLLQFYTPGMTLEGESLRTSWRHGWEATKGRFVPLAINFLLMSAANWGLRSLQHPMYDALGGATNPYFASDALAAINCVPMLVLYVWSLCLYLVARDQIGSPVDRVAAVFD